MLVSGLALGLAAGLAIGRSWRPLAAISIADLNTAPENMTKQFWWDVAWWGTPGPDGKAERDRQAERYAQWMVKG